MLDDINVEVAILKKEHRKEKDVFLKMKIRYKILVLHEKYLVVSRM